MFHHPIHEDAGRPRDEVAPPYALLVVLRGLAGELDADDCLGARVAERDSCGSSYTNPVGGEVHGTINLNGDSFTKGSEHAATVVTVDRSSKDSR